MNNKLRHIKVCICTYRRPHMLANLLKSIREQESRGAFTYSVHVVDNDKAASARHIVLEHSGEGAMKIEYSVEPQQNISMARNRAVMGLAGDYVAMIDDDEIPVPQWLWLMWNMMQLSGADGVLGPVLPSFPEACPRWLCESELCERPVHPTGKLLEYHETRTGNAFLRASLFEEDAQPFNVDFGLGGGEDIDFFRRKINLGHRFVWCNEAAVFERVSEERWNLSYYLRRQLRLGGLLGHRERVQGDIRLKNICKSVLLAGGHFSQVVMKLPYGRKSYSKPLVRMLYHVGYLSAICGWLWLQDREELVRNFSSEESQ